MDALIAFLFGSQWLVFVFVGVVLFAVAEFGYRAGLRLHAAEDERRKGQIGGVQGAVLGLLALLLGFTFSMAVDRYETRRGKVLQEANDIGTTWLRAGLLPEAHVKPVRELLRRYVDVRLKYQSISGDPDILREGMRLSGDLQRQLWQHAEEAGREAPGPLVTSFITSLNSMIDTDSERIAATRNRIPSGVWVLLMLVASFGCFTSSYGSGASGARFAFTTVLLPLLITIVITLIFDLTHGRQGFIQISQQPMLDLQSSISPPAP